MDLPLQQSQLMSPSADIPVPAHRGPTKAARRTRGEIACAECRRLKIRCDRTVPCSTCVKRGCGALCPNGTIPPGEGSRFVLAAMDHLRHKLTRMEARMRSLEDAIAIIDGADAHPLFCSSDKLNLEDPEEDEPSQTESLPVPLRESFGTLWLGNEGGSRFFGPSGGYESLLQSTDEESTQNTSLGPVLQELDPSYLPPEINLCYQAFPFTPPNVLAGTVQTAVESFLPAMDRAVILCDTFLEHLSWMFHIVSRHTLVDELIPIIYKQNPVSYGPHDLALLLIVLGIGSLVDLNLPPYNLEAQHYYRLARATVASQSVLGSQSMVTIKVLHLMSIYNGLSGKERNLEQSYILLDLAGQVALRIGFHLDPSMWKFQGREAYERRVYFWNLMAGVLWQSLVTGRPPSLLMSYIDCQIPTAEEENLYQQGEVPIGFGIWGFKASAECLVPLVRLALATKPPSYERVMDLDKTIKELPLPPSEFRVKHVERTATSMRMYVRSHYQELMLLFLHRAYFAQAMMEYGDDPMNSPYKESVTAAYSSACVVLQDTREQFMKKPLLCSRIWRIWSFTFSAAVIVGTIAIRGAHLNLQPPALEEFEAICQVFGSAAQTSSRAARALPVLEAMLSKAREANTYYRQQGKPAPVERQNVEDILYIGGNNKVIQRPSTTSTTIHRNINPQPPPAMLGAHECLVPPPVTVPSTQCSTSTSPISPGPMAPPAPPPPIYHPQVDSDHFPPRLSHPHQASSSLPPPDPPSIAPIPALQIQPPHETFADLSQGWGGLFHEVPSYADFRPAGDAYHPEPYAMDAMGVTGMYTPLTAQAGTESFFQPPLVGHDQVMLDDRWVAFMNYGVMAQPDGVREHMPYQHP